MSEFRYGPQSETRTIIYQSELLERIDLRALAEAAGARFRRGGASHYPLHGGDNPSAFHLYRAEDGGWRWHCFTRCPARMRRYICPLPIAAIMGIQSQMLEELSHEKTDCA